MCESRETPSSASERFVVYGGGEGTCSTGGRVWASWEEGVGRVCGRRRGRHLLARSDTPMSGPLWFPPSPVPLGERGEARERERLEDFGPCDGPRQGRLPARFAFPRRRRLARGKGGCWKPRSDWSVPLGVDADWLLAFVLARTRSARIPVPDLLGTFWFDWGNLFSNPDGFNMI